MPPVFQSQSGDAARNLARMGGDQNRGRRIWRSLLRIALALAVVAVLGAVFTGWHFYKLAQIYDLDRAGEIPECSMVYDSRGEVIAYLQGESRFLVPLEKVPGDFLLALLAREDARFWEHRGVDPVGILRAIRANVREGTIRQGGSTITQQLVRNTYDLRERSFSRKLLEAMLAWRFEKEFSKSTILQWYINRVYYGAGAYGVERAAQVYFNKPALKLTLAECATLVGLIRSPHRYSPFDHPQEALAQRNQVLERMAALAFIPAQKAREAARDPLGLHPGPPLPNPQNYVMEAVRRELSRHVSPRRLALGGLKIGITIDPALQKLALQSVQEQTRAIEARPGWPHPKLPEGKAIRERNPTPWLQGALIAIENRTGAIRAMVGGRDFNRSRYDRSLLARRQVGSTVKPFLYAAAFEEGMQPATLVDDSPIEPGEFPGFPKEWTPGNADGRNEGWQPAATGLIHSRNTMSVRVGARVGVRKVLELAKTLGLGSLPPYPAIFLGGFEATLRDMTTAYTVFPNLGARVQSHLIARIEDREGNLLYEAPRERIRVYSEAAAWMTSQLLEEVLVSGTGARAARLGLRHPAAGKTGTTNAHRDVWFIGYTRSLTCGVWIGFDRPRPIAPGAYGATLALPLWVRFIEAVPQSRYPALALAQPARAVTMAVCRESRLRATRGCVEAGTAEQVRLLPEMLPLAECPLHKAAPLYVGGPPEPVAERPSPPPAQTRSGLVRQEPPPPRKTREWIENGVRVRRAIPVYRGTREP